MKRYLVYQLGLMVFLGLTPSFSFGMAWFKGTGQPTNDGYEDGEKAVVEVLAGGRASGSLTASSFHSLDESGASLSASDNNDGEDADDEEEEHSSPASTRPQPAAEDNPGNPPVTSLKARLTPSCTWWKTVRKTLTPDTKTLSYMALAGGVSAAGYGVWRMICGEEVLGSAGAATGLGVTTATIGAGSLIKIHYIEKPSKKLKD